MIPRVSEETTRQQLLEENVRLWQLIDTHKNHSCLTSPLVLELREAAKEYELAPYDHNFEEGRRLRKALAAMEEG
ncbi:hypothetical protein LCGC14_1853240 [marine sediment metagenome]|uniref:Uncharacterized protein n=1 Tax=marine sediment metagenome TaxID=412755 RepID=A0A0F9G9M5_9ZZZZ